MNSVSQACVVWNCAHTQHGDMRFLATTTPPITTARPPRLLIAPPSSVQHHAPASFHTGISLPVRSPRRVRLVTTTGWWRHSRSPGFHALSATGNIGVRQRPYRVECTGSLPNSEVKRRRARLVLGWGTAREDLRVLLAFCFSFSSSLPLVLLAFCISSCSSLPLVQGWRAKPALHAQRRRHHFFFVPCRAAGT